MSYKQKMILESQENWLKLNLKYVNRKHLEEYYKNNIKWISLVIIRLKILKKLFPYSYDELFPDKYYCFSLWTYTAFFPERINFLDLWITKIMKTLDQHNIPKDINTLSLILLADA